MTPDIGWSESMPPTIHHILSKAKRLFDITVRLFVSTAMDM